MSSALSSATMLGICMALSGIASSAASPRMVEYPHPGVPAHSWSLSEESPDPDPSSKIRLTVAVAQPKEGKAALRQEILKRSDPDSDLFSHWLTKKQVDDLIRPDPEAIAAVTEWLEGAGASDLEQTTAGDFISGVLTISQAEALFAGGARYRRYSSVSPDSSATMLRLNTSYALPSELAQHVDFVGPTTRFPVLQRLRPTSFQKSENVNGRALFGPFGSSVNPTFLRKLYNATNDKGEADTKNILAMASFLGQFYSPQDLEKFFQKYASDAKVTKPTLYGPNTASNPGIEAELDVQYAMGVGRDIPAQFWSTAGQQPGNPENEPFLKWLVNLGNVTDDNLPLSMSVSYGDNEPGVEMSYADRVDVEFQKAGVRGTSILFSSGDGGVSGGQSQPCTTFVPTWPAGSVWVTAVGGTTKSKPEVCASFSSGGFSNYFGRPSYQDAAVNGYLKGGVPGIPSDSLFNSSGAGIPDVSAQGENFEVVFHGGSTPVDGTSCSAPTFNGIIALLNEARLAAGKKSMGYLNPWIYKTAGPSGAFNDVTKGSNPGCRTEGFPAAKGWDPVTGWGTPDLGRLKELALQLP